MPCRACRSRDREDVIRQAGQLDLLLPELALAGAQPSAGDRAFRVGPTRPLEQTSDGGCSTPPSTAACGPLPARPGVLLVLDDLHWAGPDAFDLLRAVVPAGRVDRRCGSSVRTGTPSAPPTLTCKSSSPTWPEIPRCRSLRLEPLPDADAERLMTDRIPEGTNRGRWYPRSCAAPEASPFFSSATWTICHPANRASRS